MAKSTLSGLLLTLLGFGFGHALTIPFEGRRGSLLHDGNDYEILNTSLGQPPLLKRAGAGNPAVFDWIKRWAAVGDSYTAGIGAGMPLGSRFQNTKDWECSRYDQSYVKVLNRAFGPTVDDFQFVACSGDRTEQIYAQVNDMEGDLDLVILTAGGNDLCLADMIKTCVFLPSNEESCDKVIDIAQNNIDTFLGDNMKDVLHALNDKMRDDSIVIYNGYAQFFNTDKDDDCNGEDWALFGGDSLPLTLERREKFNDLVKQINALIKKVVKEVSEEDDTKYRLGYSNWDPWVYDGVSGQFCDPSGSGNYPDDDQPDLQFFKSTTIDRPTTPDKKRDVSLAPRGFTKDDIYNSILMNSPNPAAVAVKKLDERAPSPPGCPGDGGVSLSPPDSIGKLFHPNEIGHVTIASFAAAELMDQRAKVLGVDAPECKKTDKFTCWQQTGSRSYAAEDVMNEHIKKVCDGELHLLPRNGKYIGSITYNAGTPDEHVFAAELSPETAKLGGNGVKDLCVESFGRVINSCDGNDPDNPMDWKFGGQWKRGDDTWEVTALGKRPWPVIQTPDGKCEGWYHGVWSSYVIYGRGWASNDYGQKRLLPAIEGCAGESTLWKFDYYDEPTEDGYEWKATFDELIWVRAKCFKNNKVQFQSGGFTHGCGGND